MSELLSALASMALLAIVLASVIFLVSRRFQVEVDQRISTVTGLLPGANCGACGRAGCKALAEALVRAADLGNLKGLECPPAGAAGMARIGEFLGLGVEIRASRVAVLRCGGSREASPAKTVYQGPANCTVAHGLFAGAGACAEGCLGFGDCVAACAFNALTMDEASGLPSIDAARCTACGLCVKACPRALIFLQAAGSRDSRVWVNCRNTEKGVLARQNCSAACIACGKCLKTCGAIASAISMANNLALIDPEQCTACGACVSECPTGAIRQERA